MYSSVDIYLQRNQSETYNGMSKTFTKYGDIKPSINKIIRMRLLTVIMWVGCLLVFSDGALSVFFKSLPVWYVPAAWAVYALYMVVLLVVLYKYVKSLK